MSQDIFDFLQQDRSDKKPSAYIKWQDGDKRSVRLISKPITGYEAWVDNPDGSRRPVRWRPNDKQPEHAISDDKPRVFMAFVVFEYSEDGQGGDIKIWSFNQRSIIDQMAMLFKDRHWSEYELVIVRAGKGLDTKYNVTGIHRQIEDNLVAFASQCDKYIDLEKMYDGDNPFLDDLPEISVAQPKPQSNDLPF